MTPKSGPSPLRRRTQQSLADRRHRLHRHLHGGARHDDRQRLLRHIAGSLAASQDESTYIISSYLISNAIILPISGWLSNVIGRKRFYMICVAIFTFASVMCGFADSLGMMLFFRVLQGVGGGGLAPTEQSIFADSFTPQQRALAFSLYASPSSPPPLSAPSSAAGSPTTTPGTGCSSSTCRSA